MDLQRGARGGGGGGETVMGIYCMREVYVFNFLKRKIIPNFTINDFK